MIDEQVNQAAKLEEERRVGLPPRESFPRHPSRNGAPFVHEAALFVPCDQMLPESGECMGDVLLNEDKERLNRARGVAAFCRIISSPITGSAWPVDYTNGCIVRSFDFRDTSCELDGRMRPKVDIEIIAMLADVTKTYQAEGNVVGFIIRARAIDPEYSFSTALARTVHQNAMVKTCRSPNGTIQTLIRSINHDCGSFVGNHLTHMELFSVVSNHDHFAELLIQWAERIRDQESTAEAEAQIEKAEKKLCQKKAKAEKAREKKEKAAKKKKRDDASDDDNKEAEEDPDSMVEELTDDEKRRIRRRCKQTVKMDVKLDINKLMSHLGAELPNSDRRRLNQDSLLETTMDAENRYLHADDGASDISTPAAVLDSLPFWVCSFRDWVSAAVVPFVATDDNQDMIHAALDTASMLDSDCRTATGVEDSSLSVERIFTLQAALERAECAGAAADMCNPEGYYTAPNQQANYDTDTGEEAREEMDWPFSNVYDPTRRFAGVTFGPSNSVPVWVRAGLEGPWASSRLLCESTWTLSMKDMEWTRFQNLRFPWAEDDTPERIREAYNGALVVGEVDAALMASVVGDVLNVLPEEALDSIEVSNEHQLTLGAPNTDIGMAAVPEAGDDDELVSMARDLSAAQHIAPQQLKVPNSDKRKRFAIDSQASERALRINNGLPLAPVPRQSAMDSANEYVSNFTIQRRETDELQRLMDELAILDYATYRRLIPAYRRYCMRQFARIYFSGAYNNGPVMRAVRTYDQKHWMAGAYTAVSNIDTELSRFGNRMAGDIITLQATFRLNIGHHLLWRMLVATRITAFDNLCTKLHQVMLSETSKGKSHLFGVFMQLSLRDSITEALIQSQQANVDPLATDDVIRYGDEAPDTITRSGQNEDPVAALASNLFRSVASEGHVSASRSVMGMCSKTFTADCHVTFMFSTNFLLAARRFERSTLMRLIIERLRHGVAVGSMVYAQHKPPSRSIEVRKEDVRNMWLGTQCLGGIACKAVLTRGLDEPDTAIVSVLLEEVLRPIDGWYPLWAESMRASQRLKSLCRGYATFSALDAVFNSPMSPLAPERMRGDTTPFDPMQMLHCAPYMFTTTEMFLISVFTTIEEAVPLDAHMYMYALATRADWTNELMDDLFVHGGRNHTFSLHSAARAKQIPAANTHHSYVSLEGVEVTPNMLAAYKAARIWAAMREHQPIDWFNMERDVAYKRSITDDNGTVVELNAFDKPVTDDMRVEARQRENLMEWYDELTDLQCIVMNRLRDCDPASLIKWRISGWLPEHFDRDSVTDMPAFWRAAEHMYTELNSTTSSKERTRHVNFVRLANGDYDPNFVQVKISVQELAPALTQLIGDGVVSRQNIDYVIAHYLADRNATIMRLPRLAVQRSKGGDQLRWDIDINNNVLLHNTNAVLVDREAGTIRINTVWLFAGRPYNHMMSILAACEDDLVPDAGRTIVLPLPYPDSPWIMQPHVIRRRRGHYIEVANPYCSNEAVLRTGLRTVVPRGATMALTKTLQPNNSNGIQLNATNFAQGVAYRATRELLIAHNHSIDREASESVRRKRPQDDVDDDDDDASPLASNKPVHETDFFTPSKPTLRFTDMSLDNQLYAGFIRRTGQDPKLVRTCAPDVRDALMRSDHRMVAALVSRAASRADREAKDRATDVSTDSPSCSEEGPFGDMVSVGEAPMQDNDEQVQRCREATQVATALKNHCLQLSSGDAYPARHVSDRPQWMVIEESAEVMEAEQKRRQRTGINLLIQIGAPPVVARDEDAPAPPSADVDMVRDEEPPKNKRWQIARHTKM